MNVMKRDTTDDKIIEGCKTCEKKISQQEKYQAHGSQNTLYTLNRCGLCLGTNLVSRYNNGRREGEETTRISLLSLWYDWIIIPSTLLHNYGYCSKLLLLLKATLIDTSLTDSRYIEVGFFSIDSRNLLDQ